jgi:Lrp/AsnC family transcriptional regulator for asnA, asnC and gidA
MDISIYGLFKSNVQLAEFISTELVSIDGIVNIESMIELKCLKLTYGRLQEREPQESHGPIVKGEAGKSRGDRGSAPKKTIDKMDKFGNRLIMELQRNSRRSNRQLARVLGVSEATVRRRINEFVESKLIELTAVPDATKVGLTSWAYLNLRVELPQLADVAQKLVKYPDVHYVGICSGSYHLLVSVIFDSPVKLSQFITEELGKIEGIIRTDTVVQLRYEKRTFGWLDSSTPPFFY